jgi:hypothetical protein
MKIAHSCRSLIFTTCLIAVCVVKINGFVLRPSRKFQAKSSASFAVAVTDEKTNKFLSWAEEEGITKSLMSQLLYRCTSHVLQRIAGCFLHMICI